MTPEQTADDIFETPPPVEENDTNLFPVRAYPTGDELLIKEKRADGNGLIVLVDTNGGEWVSHDSVSGMVERFNPEYHVGGNPTTGNAGAKMGPSADATEAAEARKELSENLPADATDAAEAEAALAAELAQSPIAPESDQPLPVPEPSSEEEPPAAEADPED